MSQVITNAFEQYWQSSLAAEQPVVLDEFILADIPNLDITSPIDPDTGLPPQSQIVHRQNVDQRGRINNNAVAYTIVMDTTVGNFSFNAMYLRNKQNGVIGMIVYKGRETKLKTDQTTGQTGNSLVKSMLMGYDQAAEATLTNVDAGTWQIDYAARLRGMDEDIRQLQADLYGHHTFVGDGFKVVETDGAYQVTKGVAIVGGLRVELNAPEVIHPGTKPIGVWVDVHRAGSLLSEHQNHFTIITSVADLADHVDSNGYQHYVAKLATVQADGTIEDGRGSAGGGSGGAGSIPDTFALWKRSMAEAGYDLIGQLGTKNTIETAKQVLLSKDGTEVYVWLGPLPKDVPADGTLESTGGIGPGMWMAVGHVTLNSKIVAATGAENIDSAVYDLATSAYAIKNRRLLGMANNLLRSGRGLKIVCVGDSITYGYDENSPDALPPSAGHVRKRAPIQYPARVQDKLTKLTNSAVTVVNSGYSGDTAKQGYNRWVNNPGGNVAHIMYGINDAAGAAGATFAEYCEYMEKLIRRYIDWGHGVVIHTSTAQRFNNNDSAGARYTQYARNIASAYGCPVFESEGVHQYCRYAAVYSDTTHFNKAGYAKYGDAVAAFILAGCWVMPVRYISSAAMQQPGRATEGIGWYGAKGAYTTFNELDSYVWNGQTGGIPGGSEGVHSFSFFLDAEAANVFAIGKLNGAEICLSDPVTTIDGKEAVNAIPQKSSSQEIAETTLYLVSTRPQGYKQWLGSLVGRGWKTVYVKHVASNESPAFINELIIEPCVPEMSVQTNSDVVPATKEILVFNCPIQPIESSETPPQKKMPLKVYFPLPKGLYRQSQIWTNFYDNLVLDISITTRHSSGGIKYNGVHKITAYTTSPGEGGVANILAETIYKSQDNCIAPDSIKYGWADPGNPSVITEGYPDAAARQVYLIFTFPDAPAAYYSVEVECSAILNGAGTFMY